VLNLLFYLADRLLRGCQSADNQVQPLQNQAIGGFPIDGSKLPDLEAEIVQIQPFCTAFSPILDFNGSTGFGARRIFLFLSFGPLADSSLFSFCFGLYNVFVYGFYILCLRLSC
jgi:hypothetical protein